MVIPDTIIQAVSDKRELDGFTALWPKFLHAWCGIPGGKWECAPNLSTRHDLHETRGASKSNSTAHRSISCVFKCRNKTKSNSMAASAQTKHDRMKSIINFDSVFITKILLTQNISFYSLAGRGKKGCVATMVEMKRAMKYRWYHRCWVRVATDWIYHLIMWHEMLRTPGCVICGNGQIVTIISGINLFWLQFGLSVRNLCHLPRL